MLIKDLKRKHWRKPRWTGPHQVLLTTPTVVNVKERTTGTHASHCRKVPPLETEAQGESPAPLTDEEQKLSLRCKKHTNNQQLLQTKEETAKRRRKELKKKKGLALGLNIID